MTRRNSGLFLTFSLFLFSSGVAGFSAWAHSPSLVQKNNQALQGLLGKDTHKSRELLLQGLAEEPFSFELRMNLGLVYLAQEDYLRAAGEFLAAAELFEESPDKRFQALFNLALARTAAGSVAGALEAYQKALQLEPNSLEVKQNIELLWQMVEGESQGDGEGDPQEGQGDSEDGEGDEEQDSGENQSQNYQDSQPNQTFESERLTPDDVRRIMEELKAQEQAIRAKELSQGGRDVPLEKDW